MIEIQNLPLDILRLEDHDIFDKDENDGNEKSAS